MVVLPHSVRGKSMEWEYAFLKRYPVKHEGVNCIIESKSYNPIGNSVVFDLTEIFIASKEIAGMSDKKTFTKADLVAGKHVVELVNGSRYTLVNLLNEVVGFNLQAEKKGFHDTWYQNLREDMIYPYNKDHTVVAVYEATAIDVYYSCSNHNLNLVWKRPPAKTQTEIELEKLQQQIAELQAQANKLQQTL
jgi:hypothetical protein